MKLNSSLRGEPSLDDLMADPIFHALLRRDGLDEAGVRAIVERAAVKIRARAQACGACA